MSMLYRSRWTVGAVYAAGNTVPYSLVAPSLELQMNSYTPSYPVISLLFKARLCLEIALCHT